VVGVLGASGGLGASTLAVALAVVAARAGRLRRQVPAVAVDGAVSGGGLDVTACVEHVPGLRWSDLARTRGEVSGPDLADALPMAGAARVLSGVPGGAKPAPEVVTSVVAALRSTAELVVVDLPRADGAAPLVAACDVVLLLAGATPRHLSDAVAVRAGLASAAAASSGSEPDDPRLVLRSGAAAGELAAAVADHLDLPLAARWRDDGRVARDADRGLTPGVGRRSSLARLCHGLLDGPPDGLLQHVRTDRGAA
jgi:hypothetical protein